MENKKITVLIVDDESVFRVGLTALLEQKGDIKVIGEAANGVIMIEKAIKLTPDIILTNIKVPALDGIKATQELFKIMPDSRVIALSSSIKDDHILQMIELGALGYLRKTADVEEITDAIHTVYNRKPFFCKEVTSRLTDLVSRNYKLPIKLDTSFTDRELEIIRLICKEYTSKEIALALHLSKRTVEGHRTRIMDKIGAKSIAGIITYAVEFGIYKKED